jgi:endogenous inhibitor of DNA gyrase (YacG/DUF329 family)
MPTFNCPTCQKPVEWSPASKWRPFCSERCRLIDLGAWMSEQHAIPGEEISNDLPEAPPAPERPDDETRRH